MLDILYPHQKTNAELGTKLVKANGWAYLAMETRTGKTLTALSIAEQCGAKMVLFLTRKRAISSIESDYAYGEFDFGCTVTNYEQAQKLSLDYDFVIVDEAHNFGTYPKPSMRTKNVAKLCRAARYCLLLSATPTPESFSQIYHQLKMLGDKVPFIDTHSNFYKFAKVHIRPTLINVGTHSIVSYSDCDFIDISPYSLYMTQADAGITTTISDFMVEVECSPTTKQAFSDIKKEGFHVTPNGQQLVYDSKPGVMSACHQLCGGTLKGSDFVPDLFKVLTIIRNFSAKKIAIFYKYIAEGDLLREHFKTTDCPDTFNASTGLVFVGQISSVREGVNIKTADAIIMYNIDFSAVCYWQARNRLQSMDRETPAHIYWLMSDLGLEKQIYKTVLDKRNFTTRHFDKC